ncbi:hypothetical protein CHS0354_020096, partial [Potamilus streckersoni]
MTYPNPLGIWEMEDLEILSILLNSTSAQCNVDTNAKCKATKTGDKINGEIILNGYRIQQLL